VDFHERRSSNGRLAASKRKSGDERREAGGAGPEASRVSESQLMTFPPQEMWCLFNSRNMLANLEGLCLCVEVFQKCLPN